VKAVWALLAMAVALALQITVARFSIAAGAMVNLVLVAVVYTALAYGPVTGLLAGTASGIAQDALSGAILGIGGLAKTLVGFAVGVIGSQFIVAQPIPRFVVFLSATIVHEAVFLAVLALLPDARAAVQYSRIFTQAVMNGLVGILIFWAVEALPGIVQRRRTNRAAAFRRRRL
jgi:rod shape-determining protein MreD